VRKLAQAFTCAALAGALGFVTTTVAAEPDFAALSRIPAVSGYEQDLEAAVARDLAGLHPNTDNLHDVWVTVGSGSPHRLIVAAIDQPGYVVSGITPHGYMRVQRLPQVPPNAVFDTLSFAQPVRVVTAHGALEGAFAGLSIHLAPRRLNPPGMTHIDELYLDIGARSAAEVRSAGADLLDPVALAQPPITIGTDDEAGAGAGDRFGWEALLEVAQGLARSRISGTTTVAFVTQQWLGGRGLARLMTELPADEMIFVGRVAPQVSGGARASSGGDATAGESAAPLPGDGVLIGAPGARPASGDDLPGRLQSLASGRRIPARLVSAAPPRMTGFGAFPELPHRFAALGVPTLLPVTPGETFSRSDLRNLTRLLETYLEEPVRRMSGSGGPFDAAGPQATGAAGASGATGGPSADPGDATLEALSLAYGASGHEEAVRQAVLAQLPAWARRLAKTDAAGNLVLSLGSGRGARAPNIVFDAHIDEIGYQVTQIESDGRLQVKELGGFYGRYYLGHVMLVHTAGRHAVGGVLELPEGWDHAGFKWPPAFSTLKQSAYVYVGTRNEEQTRQLGIRVGDYLTIPKVYHPLLGSLVAVRSLDDRVGDTALVAAVRALGPDFARKWPGRRVTFVWTTGEEVGLDGAAAYAASAAKHGHAPDVVFAIDTFVSSDSPLETQRFADAIVGQGFVVRAVDNSNIDPPVDVARVIRLAHDHNIPVQYGATGGGNDGAAYTRYGTVDVALGWPMVYSHSPVEMASTKDVDALSRIVAVLATQW
jgi:putative aminopeptidase FrvX